MNILLYGAVVLIWGTTWFAIKLQLGISPVALSIAWRFGLAALVLIVILAWRKQLKPLPRNAWGLVAIQGLCLFCVNFLCFYNASRYIPTGFEAVVFSTSTLWNAINARVFMGRGIASNVITGGMVGLMGLVALFSPEFSAHHDGMKTLLGLGLALAGTLCFSAGNLLSARLQSQGLKPLYTNAWGMLFGALVLLLASMLSGQQFVFDTRPVYIGALLWLAIPGSVIGFTAYLMLVGRLGAERAAYCTVLFPLVALNVSAVMEGYRWTPLAISGVLLVMAGNWLVFRKPRAARVLAPG
ncbi:DMT family transporter [Silvimonas soli]|uniref:DMT family transporter n=1 Tax=Silvimonas soli TaxID=2980100 RepID=UPI0024B334D6|nr:EamA family transporter [Silvimonas soli]